jgi:hypothetical protein
MILTLFCTPFAHALTLDEMAGVYNISTDKKIEFLGPGMSVEYILAIDKNKDEFGHNIVGVNEYIKQTIGTTPAVTISEIKCWGTAEVSNEKLMTADLSCPNQRVFEQEIDFSKMKKLEDGTFTAPVYSSLYYNKVDMVFKKINPNVLKK